MKRFFSLMLVALLLVSAIPFQAFAATVVFRPDFPAETNQTVFTINDGDKLTVDQLTGEGIDVNIWWARDNGTRITMDDTYTGTVYAGPEDKVKAYHDALKAEQDAKDAPQTVQVLVRVDGVQVGTSSITLKKGESVLLDQAKAQSMADMTHRTFVSFMNTDGDNVLGATLYHGEDLRTALNDRQFKLIVNLTKAAYDKTIYYKVDGETHTMQNYYINETINVPTAPAKLNYQFMGWYPAANGSGNPLVSGTVCKADTAEEWHAWYIYNPTKDGMSTITVTARCYIDGIGSSYLDVPVLSQAVIDTTNVFDWLQTHKNTTILDAVYEKVDTEKYEWKNRYFYNHNGTEVLTEQTTFADGAKAILIKLEEKDNTTRANVQLYLHKSTTSENPFRILDMNGITSGMNVTRTTAKNLIDDYYDFDSIGNLYTHADWNALMDGENVDGRTSIYISDNGTYKIHVVVKDASSKSSSKADSTNPKTGDYITIAAGTMVLAAAAVITLAEMKKRKMI